MVSLKSKQRSFDGAIKIEDKAFKSMLESSPLHGGLPRNACYASIIDVKFVTLRATVSWRWYYSSWVDLLASARGITSCFVKAFYTLFSHVLRELRL
jgi:hypothetical protein